MNNIFFPLKAFCGTKLLQNAKFSVKPKPYLACLARFLQHERKVCVCFENFSNNSVFGKANGLFAYKKYFVPEAFTKLLFNQAFAKFYYSVLGIIKMCPLMTLKIKYDRCIGFATGRFSQLSESINQDCHSKLENVIYINTLSNANLLAFYSNKSTKTPWRKANSIPQSSQLRKTFIFSTKQLNNCWI